MSIKKILYLLRRFSRSIGDTFVLSPVIKKYEKLKPEPKTILVVGVVLQNRANHYKHISSVFGNSICHDVQQVWAVLKGDKKFMDTDGIDHVYIDYFVPRSQLINSLIEQFSVKKYDYIIIVDDDIRLPQDFVDQFLLRQELYDFALAQPARTENSIISHKITTQKKSVMARQTLFVEIGPLVSIRCDAQKLLLPLDTDSPMGWGLDYVWSHVLLEKNMRQGIIDIVPIAHTLRNTGKSYDSVGAMDDMNKYLSKKPHLSVEDSHVVINEYME